MVEHPIIFSQMMALAIRDGKKTQTRRVRIGQWNVGDTLWVRESHFICEVQGQGVGNYFVVFRDEFDGPEPRPRELRPYQARPGAKSAIFMPHWWCRTFLEATDIRQERLQSISADDCVAEGFSSREQFRELWDKLNAKRGFAWESNPSVWVITFKIVSEHSQGTP